jgi:hypothetical protein
METTSVWLHETASKLGARSRTFTPPVPTWSPPDIPGRRCTSFRWAELGKCANLLLVLGESLDIGDAGVGRPDGLA